MNLSWKLDEKKCNLILQTKRFTQKFNLKSLNPHSIQIVSRIPHKIPLKQRRASEKRHRH